MPTIVKRGQFAKRLAGVVIALIVSITFNDAFGHELSPNDPGFHELTGACSSADSFRSAAYGVSADGSEIVGTLAYHGLFSSSTEHAFVWTMQSGIDDIGQIHGFSEADAVSANGSIIAGTYTDASGASPLNGVFLWTRNNGFQDLGPLNEAIITGVSDNGDIIGTFLNTTNSTDATSDGFIWPSGSSPIDLGQNNWASSISPDGKTVLGNALSTGKVFRWTSNGGVSEFNGILVTIIGISDQAMTMVGSSLPAGTPRGTTSTEYFLFRRTSSGNVSKIASLPAGSPLNLFSISLDGSTAVGWYTDPSNCQHAFYYSLGNNAEN